MFAKLTERVGDVFVDHVLEPLLFVVLPTLIAAAIGVLFWLLGAPLMFVVEFSGALLGAWLTCYVRTVLHDRRAQRRY